MELIIQPKAFLRSLSPYLPLYLDYPKPEKQSLLLIWSKKTRRENRHAAFTLHVSEWMFWNHSCKSLCDTPSLGGKLQTDVTVTVTNGYW